MLHKIFILINFLGLIQCNTEKSNKNNSILLAALLFSQTQKSSSATTTTFSIPIDTADTVTSAPNHTGSDFKDKAKAVNGIRGTGIGSGSLDVFSLASTGVNASIVLEWSNRKILNGVGIDFIVFENAFRYNANAATVFMEAIIVEVSQDNINYCGFSPTYNFTPNTTYSNSPVSWMRFAGITPSLYNVETNILLGNDLYDVSKTGGDGFDLENLSATNDFGIGCSVLLRDKIKSEGFVYLRLTSATARINPDTTASYLQDPGSFGGGPDIDGVLARYRVPR